LDECDRRLGDQPCQAHTGKPPPIDGEHGAAEHPNGLGRIDDEDHAVVAAYAGRTERYPDHRLRNGRYQQQS
jgi:hypothetical protein